VCGCTRVRACAGAATNLYIHTYAHTGPRGPTPELRRVAETAHILRLVRRQAFHTQTTIAISTNLLIYRYTYNNIYVFNIIQYGVISTQNDTV